MRENKKKLSTPASIVIRYLQDEEDKKLHLYLYLIKNEIKRREIKYAESI
jgi:hypothetical protein